MAEKPMPNQTAQTKEKMTSDDRLYESMKNMSTSSLQQIAGQMGAEAMAARRILRDRGDQGAMPSGDQEPTQGLKYGGKAKKKKMMMGGKAYANAGRKPMMCGGDTRKKK